MSLDGYIADLQGGVAWLGSEDCDAEMPDSYGGFVRDVDTVIMGWNTYHQIVTELSPDEWVYEGLQADVITHRPVEQREGVFFVAESPCTLVQRLKQAERQEYLDMWWSGYCGPTTPWLRADRRVPHCRHPHIVGWWHKAFWCATSPRLSAAG